MSFRFWLNQCCTSAANIPCIFTMPLSGVMAKSAHGYGGGVNYLCLPLDPEFPPSVNTSTHTNAIIYGVEYQDWNPGLSLGGVYDEVAPCAVCEAQGRSAVLMLPAKPTCPLDWTKEYDGFLATQGIYNKGADYVCVCRAVWKRERTQLTSAMARICAASRYSAVICRVRLTSTVTSWSAPSVPSEPACLVCDT